MTKPQVEYEFQSFGQTVTVLLPRDPGFQFKKKPWVPEWLWNLVSVRDPIKELAEAIERGKAKRDIELKTMLFKESR